VEKGRLFLESYFHSLDQQKKSKRTTMRGFIELLDQLDDNLSEFIFRMTADARDVRKALFQTAKSRKKGGDEERPLRLTDPCPCGSGIKFQKCCRMTKST
jgi:uncharacterized protein YecA (UPF0149 family)